MNDHLEYLIRSERVIAAGPLHASDIISSRFNGDTKLPSPSLSVSLLSGSGDSIIAFTPHACCTSYKKGGVDSHTAEKKEA